MQTMAKNRIVQMEKELEILEKKKPKSGFARGFLKKKFEDLAYEYDLNFTTVKNKYYSDYKGKFEEGKFSQEQHLKTESTENKAPTQQIQEERTPHEEKNMRPPYEPGDVIKVKVRNLSHYGVFVETMDPPGFQGLVHISEVQHGYVEDLADFFEPDQITNAEVKKITDDNKIEFSTKDVEITNESIIQYEKEEEEKPKRGVKKNPPINLMSDKLNPIRDELKMEEDVQQEKQEPKKQQLVQETKTVQADQKKKDGVKDFSVEKEIPEATEVIKFLNGIVGMISPKGKMKLKELIETHGVFKFTVAMMQTEKEFENDLSLYLMKEIEKNLRDGL